VHEAAAKYRRASIWPAVGKCDVVHKIRVVKHTAVLPQEDQAMAIGSMRDDW